MIIYIDFDLKINLYYLIYIFDAAILNKYILENSFYNECVFRIFKLLYLK